MTEAFTPDEITSLSADIDAQLRELGTPGTGLAKGRTPQEALGEKQRRAIEAATGDDALTFLQRFKQAARKNLCEENGGLYTQCQKWKS